MILKQNSFENFNARFKAFPIKAFPISLTCQPGKEANSQTSNRQKMNEVLLLVKHQRTKIYKQLQSWKLIKRPRNECEFFIKGSNHQESMTLKAECFYCFEVFWTLNVKRSTSFQHGFSNVLVWEFSRIIWEPIGCYKAGSIGDCLLVIHMMNAMNNLICWPLDELLKVDFKKINVASSDRALLRIRTISRSQNSCLLKKRFWWMTQLQLEENKKNLKTSRKLENSKGRGIVLIHCFSTNSLRK